MRLEVRDLACVRGGRTIFEGMTFAAEAGAGMAVTGPNGAGKSSLLRTLAGFLPSAKGTITLEGGDAELPLSEQCHFVGHLNGVRKALTVAENLSFWAGYYDGGRVEQALALFGLDAISDIPAAMLSAGQARRLGLARLLVADRPVWLLDEPGVSLDAASLNILAQVIREHLASGGIVIAATHAPLGVKLRDELQLGPGGMRK